MYKTKLPQWAERRIENLEVEKKRLWTALITILDSVDYEHHACKPTEMVGAVLPLEVLKIAHKTVLDCTPHESTKAS